VAATAPATLAALVVLGAVGAALGGAERWRGALRVGVGGAVALAITFAVGSLLGTAVG
jgi:VIT1/CCC1 family predicted Fe2+/Mn2+ transporter